MSGSMSLSRRDDMSDIEIRRMDEVPVSALPRRIVQFNYEWRIGNFRKAAMKEEVLRSQPFPSKDPQRCKWVLELYPHGSPEIYNTSNQRWLSVFLILKDCIPPEHVVSVTVQFGIRKFKPEVKDVYFEPSDVDFERERRFGLVKFMSHPEFFDKDEHFLHHDSATILCDVKINNAIERASPTPFVNVKRTSSFGSPKSFKSLLLPKARTEERTYLVGSEGGSQYERDGPPLPPPLPPAMDAAVPSASSRSYSQSYTYGHTAPARAIEIPKDTLLDDMVSLLNRGQFSDVTLDCGKREFNVHKAILAARSPVFDSMFSSPDNVTSNHYEISDVTSRAMKELLYFIYTGHVDKTESIVDEVLEAAQKYQVSQLQAICESIILRDLTVDNAIKTLILAHESKAQQLKEIVLEFIARNFQAVKRTEGWSALRTSHTDLYGDIIEFM